MLSVRLSYFHHYTISLYNFSATKRIIFFININRAFAWKMDVFAYEHTQIHRITKL